MNKLRNWGQSYCLINWAEQLAQAIILGSLAWVWVEASLSPMFLQYVTGNESVSWVTCVTGVLLFQLLLDWEVDLGADDDRAKSDD